MSRRERRGKMDWFRDGWSSVGRRGGSTSCRRMLDILILRRCTRYASHFPQIRRLIVLIEFDCSQVVVERWVTQEEYRALFEQRKLAWQVSYEEEEREKERLRQEESKGNQSMEDITSLVSRCLLSTPYLGMC